MKTRPVRISDRIQIAKLYHAVAGSVKGIARRPEEITETWVFSLFNKPEEYLTGIVFTETNKEGDEKIIGFAHAEKHYLKAYQHILFDFTIIVAPANQNVGIGKKLGVAFLKHISENRPDINRLEMEVRKGFIHFGAYEKAGFKMESEVKQRIRNMDGTFSDIVMFVWTNPNFKH